MPRKRTERRAPIRKRERVKPKERVGQPVSVAPGPKEPSIRQYPGVRPLPPGQYGVHRPRRVPTRQPVAPTTQPVYRGQPVGVAPGPREPVSPTLRQRPRGWPTAPPGGVAAHRRRGTPIRTAPGPRTYDGWLSPIPPGTPAQVGYGVPPMRTKPQKVKETKRKK